MSYLKLGVGPSWDLDDHVQDGLLLVGVQRDIVERREWLAILLDVAAVVESVLCADRANAVFGWLVRHVARLVTDGEMT